MREGYEQRLIGSYKFSNVDCVKAMFGTKKASNIQICVIS